MFDSASGRYVLLNTVMTFGRDGAWRSAAAGALIPKKDGKILDICAGTGDLALKMARRFPDEAVYGLDYSPEMLKIARRRARALKCDNLDFIEGDCAQMPFESCFFDYVTISFGMRNLSFSSDILGKALAEVYRVLKEGGRFIIIETSQPPNIFTRRLFHFFALKVIPLAGILFAGHKEPYAYLGRSMANFYDKGRLARFLEEKGFREEMGVPFAFGAILLSIFKKEG